MMWNMKTENLDDLQCLVKDTNKVVEYVVAMLKKHGDRTFFCVCKTEEVNTTLVGVAFKNVSVLSNGPSWQVTEEKLLETEYPVHGIFRNLGICEVDSGTSGDWKVFNITMSR